MSARVYLAKVIYKEGAYCGACEYAGWETCADCRRCCIGYAAAALEHRKPRTITNEAELDKLPAGSVVLSETYRHYANGTRIAFQLWNDGRWYRGARSGDTHPDNFLPATVLHEPGAK